MPKFTYDPNVHIKWCKHIGGECDQPNNCKKCPFKKSIK